MLIDGILPHFLVREYHETTTTADPAHAFAAVKTADLAANPIVRLLLGLRGLGRRTHRPTARLTDFRDEGFVPLAEDAPNEIVIGLQGPFWRPDCRLDRIDLSTFDTPVPANKARAAWNFSILRRNGVTVIATETRVACGVDARRSFRTDWLVIRPFSGLIRRLMLRAIRRAAERTGSPD